MNKRQAKKLYKKIHGCNPPEGRIPAALLRDPGKMNTHLPGQADEHASF